MSRRRFDLQYVGPLKLGKRVRSENPREEIWNWISPFGITSWLQKQGAHSHSWKDWGPYCVARIRQAVEFRAAAHSGSVLTRPLPLYYSSLNLLRGFLALINEVQPRMGHGLKFQGENQKDIFQTRAEIATGTFTDYLDASKVPYQKGTVITLQEALERIIETAYFHLSSSLSPTEVFEVHVSAYHSGKVSLQFYGSGQEAEFRNSWQEWFPKLRELCSLEPSGRILAVDTNKVETHAMEKIADFCHRVLELNLRSYEDPVWFAVRQSKPELNLPRPAFYLIGAFILSSVVRYNPELLLSVSNPDSEHGWLIARFLEAAERYFPHLLLNWILPEPVYF